MAHPGHDLGAVRLDLHASTAAVALLPAPQLAIDGFQRYRYAGGEAGERRPQALAVGLSGGLKSQHSDKGSGKYSHDARIFIVSDGRERHLRGGNIRPDLPVLS